MMPSTRKVPLYNQRRNGQPVRIPYESVIPCVLTLEKVIRQNIQGRLYGYGSSRPRSVGVRVTHFPTTARAEPYVVAEEVLGSEIYIHDCEAQTYGPRRSKHFKVFLTRHRLLPSNTAIPAAQDGSRWRGQLLVLRMSEDRATYSSLRRGDQALIHRMVPRHANLFGCVCFRCL